MTFEKEFNYFKEMEVSKKKQIDEINEQIRELTKAQEEFSDVANYLNELKGDLQRLYKEIQDELDQINIQINVYN